MKPSDFHSLFALFYPTLLVIVVLCLAQLVGGDILTPESYLLQEIRDVLSNPLWQEGVYQCI
jgi:hypothetical protein